MTEPLPVPAAPPLEGAISSVGRCVGEFRTGSPMNLLSAVEQHFRRRCSALLVSCQRVIAEGEPPALHLRLHPLDRGVRFTAESGDQLRVEADPLLVGPGYLDLLTRELQDLALHLDLAFEPPLQRSPSWSSEAASARLIAAARAALDDLTETGICPPLLLPDDVLFQHDGVTASPLGPQGMAWLAGAAVGSLRPVDAFPWPEPGLGARYLRGRALSALWTDVRWRPPQSREETATLVEIDGLLARAHELEPNLDLPWVAWAELHTLIASEGHLVREVAQRAARAREAAPTAPPLGYRRRPVRVRLPAGWWITLPGSFGERLEDDGTLCAFDGPHTLWVTVMSGARRPELRHGGRAWAFEAPGLAGLCQMGRDPDDRSVVVFGGQMFSTEVPSAVVMTATFADEADFEWADAAWRSISREPYGLDPIVEIEEG